jgi:hypothetical protein
MHRFPGLIGGIGRCFIFYNVIIPITLLRSLYYWHLVSFLILINLVLLHQVFLLLFLFFPGHDCMVKLEILNDDLQSVQAPYVNVSAVF